MQLPHRFHLTYTDKDGKKKEPVMLHRAIFGSFERFTGIIIENFKGAFPTWLNPEQVRILPVNNDEAVMKYAAAIEKKLKNKNVRVSIDDRNEKLNYKIREAQTKKVPYTIVIGNKEAESKNVTYRLYGHMDSKTVAENEFVKIIEKDIKERQVTRNY
jgi:threonyl-tRNA synthetase